MKEESSSLRDMIQFRLTRFDAQIKMEFDLIGHRMNWLMTSQAFLFGAFGVAVTSTSSRNHLLTEWLLFLIPIVGGLTALVVGVAISAAHRVVKRLKPDRQKLEATAHLLGYEQLGVGVESLDHVAGNLPAHFLPWLLLIVWILLLGVAIVCVSHPVQG